MRAFQTGPGIYRIGALRDGRNVYRATCFGGPGYWATEEIVTSWDEGTWWTTERPEVREWLKELVAIRRYKEALEKRRRGCANGQYS